MVLVEKYSEFSCQCAINLILLAAVRKKWPERFQVKYENTKKVPHTLSDGKMEQFLLTALCIARSLRRIRVFMIFLN